MKTITLKCNHCQKEFERLEKDHRNNVKRGRKNVFCSPNCRSLSKRHTIDKTLNCLNCKKQFKYNSIEQKFCSRSCAAIKNNSLKSKKVYNCTICNETIFGKAKYCSICKRKKRFGERSIDYTEITLQNLKDRYGTMQYHAKIRGYARSIYKLSGKPMQCYNCGYSLHVDICHIRDVQDYPMNSYVSEVNNIDNLIALDKRCHWEFDHGHLFIV